MQTILQLELINLVKACQQFQNDNLPTGCKLHINLSDNSAEVQVHRCADHSMGLEVKRLIGAEDAEKLNFDPESPWHVLRGKLIEGVNFTIFCQGLPPMCRIETYEEEIPEEQLVQTGEKTVVKRTRICCGTESK